MTSLVCDDKNQSRTDSLPAACTLLSLRATLPRTTSTSSGSISPTWYHLSDDGGLQKLQHDEKRRIDPKHKQDQGDDRQHELQDEHIGELHEINSSTCSSRATTPRSAFWNTVMAPLTCVNLQMQTHSQPTMMSLPAQSPMPLDSFNSRHRFALHSDRIDPMLNVVVSNTTTASTNLTTCSSSVSAPPPEHANKHRHHGHYQQGHGRQGQSSQAPQSPSQCRKHPNRDCFSLSLSQPHTNSKSETEPTFYTSDHAAVVTQNDQVAPSMNIPCIVCGVRFRKLGHLNMHWRSVHARRDGSTNCISVPNFTQECSHIKHASPTHTNRATSSVNKPAFLRQSATYNGGSNAQNVEPMDNYQGAVHVDPTKLKIMSAAGSSVSSQQQYYTTQNIVNGAVAKSNRAYGCPQCEASFRRGSDRNRHMRMVHAKIRPFECPTCGNHFGRKSFLEAHILTVHHKLRPFRCSCGAAFGQRSSLTRHTRKIHGREPN